MTIGLSEEVPEIHERLGGPGTSCSEDFTTQFPKRRQSSQKEAEISADWRNSRMAIWEDGMPFA